MKFLWRVPACYIALVAPFAGAWIEIDVLPNQKNTLESLPSRERGLKSHVEKSMRENHTSLPSRERGLKSTNQTQNPDYENVAPFAGAWIEIYFIYIPPILNLVAPFAGAWIEMYKCPADVWMIGCRSLRRSVD